MIKVTVTNLDNDIIEYDGDADNLPEKHAELQVRSMEMLDYNLWDYLAIMGKSWYSIMNVDSWCLYGCYKIEYYAN